MSASKNSVASKLDAGWIDNPEKNRSVIPAIVLAGGLSRRMGGVDKTLIKLGGKPMIACALDCLNKQADPLMINANGEASRYEQFGYPVVADIYEGHAGPLAGILTAMRWAQENISNAERVVTVAADTPFLPDDLVSKLASAAGQNFSTIVLACSRKRVHPVVGLWPLSLADDLENFLNNEASRKVLAFVDNYLLAKVAFGDIDVAGIEVDPFFNVNTPEDLETAELVLAEMSN